MIEETMTTAAENEVPVVAESEAPAATLEELEGSDLYASEERPPFRITDDRCADWAVRKIAEEKAEYERLKALAEEQIAAINDKVEAAKRRFENGTSFLTDRLAEYFQSVPHKKTATTEKYRLLSGTLTLKVGGVQIGHDDKSLVPWLRGNGFDNLVKVEEKAQWGEFKKKLEFKTGVAIVKESGQIVDCLTVTDAPDTFTVDV